MARRASPSARAGTGMDGLDGLTTHTLDLARRAPADVHATVARLRPARVACFMMQKNERVLLDLWLRYHTAMFGASQLHVFDNGSTDPQVRQRLRRAEADGVRVFWEYKDREHFEKKGEVFRKVMQDLAPEFCDFVMPLDCDEFVAHVGLDGEVSCEADVVSRYLASQHLRDPRVLITRGSYFNVPGEPGLYFFTDERKCFLAHGMVKGLGMGFHQATSKHSTTEVRTEILHFHYRYKPYSMYDEHARQKLAARVADFDAATLKDYKGKGSHMTRFLTRGEESYARFFRRFARIPLVGFQRKLRELGTDIPY